MPGSEQAPQSRSQRRDCHAPPASSGVARNDGVTIINASLLIPNYNLEDDQGGKGGLMSFDNLTIC